MQARRSSRISRLFAQSCFGGEALASLPRGLRWFRRGNPGLRGRWQLLFDRLQNNALGHLVYLDAELLYLDAELFYAALNVGEFKGQGLKLLDQFIRGYGCGGRYLTVRRRLFCRAR